MTVPPKKIGPWTYDSTPGEWLSSSPSFDYESGDADLFITRSMVEVFTEMMVSHTEWQWRVLVLSPTLLIDEMFPTLAEAVAWVEENLTS
tara:strand:- start:668 stop:937 length:270 start_codon:yes stop_codon:yes gene_type:complete